MNQAARSLLDANWNRRRVIAAETVGLAHQYLTVLAPGAPWRLVGVEVETGRGPVDLVWANDIDGRVLFDEIKTSRQPTRAVPNKWAQQVRRYAEGGLAQHGEAFAGVRLLPIDAMHLARLVTGVAPSVRIAPTASEPLRMVGGER